MSQSELAFAMRRPVLWIDIDGTVRHGAAERGGHFVKSADDVVIFPEVPLLLAAYRAAGWRIVGISNQGGIALGHLTHQDVLSNMRQTMRLSGDMFDRLAWCSHHPEADDPEMAHCWCRKPRIGLLIQTGMSLAAQREEIYPPHLGLLVGDRPEDRACADNAGLRFMDAAEWRKLDPLSLSQPSTPPL